MTATIIVTTICLRAWRDISQKSLYQTKTTVSNYMLVMSMEEYNPKSLYQENPTPTITITNNKNMAMEEYNPTIHISSKQ
jgi:hypothetical protein